MALLSLQNELPKSHSPVSIKIKLNETLNTEVMRSAIERFKIKMLVTERITRCPIIIQMMERFPKIAIKIIKVKIKIHKSLT